MTKYNVYHGRQGDRIPQKGTRWCGSYDKSGQSGPGRSHRKGITLIKMFPDDKAAKLWCEGVVWPDGPVCPRCNSGKHIYTQIHAV